MWLQALFSQHCPGSQPHLPPLQPHPGPCLTRSAPAQKSETLKFPCLSITCPTSPHLVRHDAPRPWLFHSASLLPLTQSQSIQRTFPTQPSHLPLYQNSCSGPVSGPDSPMGQGSASSFRSCPLSPHLPDFSTSNLAAASLVLYGLPQGRSLALPCSANPSHWACIYQIQAPAKTGVQTPATLAQNWPPTQA